MGINFKRLFGALAIVGLAMTPIGASAEDMVAEAWVQDLADSAVDVLRDPENTALEIATEFEDLLASSTALRSFGRSALGAYSRVITEDEFETYVALLQQYATGVVQSRLSEYSDERIEVGGSSEDARDNFTYVSVESQIIGTDGSEIAGVRWLLIRRDDQYRIYDLTVETPAENGTFSLLQTQREEFNSVISSNGNRITALLDFLRERITESGMTPAA